MTKAEIQHLAREAGLPDPMVFFAGYERFAALVAAHKAEVALAEAYRCGYEAGVKAEREACAKLCEKTDDGTPYNLAEACAAAIRARGTT